MSVGNLIADKGYPDGRKVQTGLADRVSEIESNGSIENTKNRSKWDA
jgi:hypothetical protein